MITKVIGARGEVLHDCADAGCSVSWDGYVINAERMRSELTADEVTIHNLANLADGDPMPGRVNPSDEWDLSTDGEAHLRE